MSVSTISNGTRQFRRSPSSILSSDSDIRFTRKKLSSQYKCGCCIIACFLLLLLLASVAVYVGYTFFAAQFPEEQIFRATFRVIEGDTFSPELADPSTDKFKDRSRDYKERLNLLFKRSPIKHGFVGTEVLALDGEEGKDLIVHFNIHVNPDYADVEAKDLEKIMSDEISLAESLYFRNLTIDSSSVEVKPSDLITTIVSTTSLPTTAKSLPVTSTPPKPRRCTPLGLAYCSSMGNNYTTYPNILGHQNLDEVESDVISFRELVDAECYRHAYKFVCQILQPSCQRDGDKVDMVLPCKSFCKDFMVGCGSRLPTRFKDLLDCKNFPEYGQARNCITKPDCVQDLQARALSPRICDGVADCQDLSDERSCTYCPKNSIHCGIGRACIPADKRCDGRKDCPDGSDERGCLNIAPSVADMKRINTVTPHAPRYYPSGFVVFNEKGEIGKLCTENLNKTLPPNVTEEILYTAASSLCNTLSYKGVRSVKIVKDPEPNISYVSMKNPTSSEITFVRTLCPSREVLKVSCEDIECGIQTTHSTYQGLSKMSVHGDWPWHVALFKEDVHICDGTLVSPEWIVTTTSCFQGQSKAEWRAKFGSVRLSSMSPWEQERTIVGMVKSPVEGSTIAMIKLDQPVFINDFVRPVCLLDKRISVREEYITNNCNTLGWARNREHLQRVQIQATDMDKCENISISSVNGMCAEPAFGQNDCNEEEFAGSPMLCLVSDDLKWSLIGVTNWRIGCSTLADQRPRMYDKISSNVDWIKETISAVS